jgi:hypothetical protein
MKTGISAETSVNVYRITGHHVPEDSVLSSQSALLANESQLPSFAVRVLQPRFTLCLKQRRKAGECKGHM